MGAKLDKNGYAPSILTGWEKVCLITGVDSGDLVRHEIYYGIKNRAISKKYGFWCYLVPELHNTSKNGVHFNKELDLSLKKTAQTKFEETHTREEFIKLIGRNYL